MDFLEVQIMSVDVTANLEHDFCVVKRSSNAAGVEIVADGGDFDVCKGTQVVPRFVLCEEDQ